MNLPKDCEHNYGVGEHCTLCGSEKPVDLVEKKVKELLKRTARGLVIMERDLRELVDLVRNTK